MSSGFIESNWMLDFPKYYKYNKFHNLFIWLIAISIALFLHGIITSVIFIIYQLLFVKSIVMKYVVKIVV